MRSQAAENGIENIRLGQMERRFLIGVALSIFSVGAYTTIADFLFAIIAGFAIMPAVFAAGIEPGAGPGLVFETLPFIFNQMGAAVPWLSATVAILFFLTILVAALTSSISLMEVGVSYLMENTRLGRKSATVLTGIFVWLIGIVCSLSFGPLADFKLFSLSVFDFFDYITSNIMLPVGGLLLAVFAGWRLRRANYLDELTNSGALKIPRWLCLTVYYLVKLVAPVGILLIFFNCIFS